MATKNFDFNRVFVLVDGQRIKGFAEDGIQFQYNEDRVEHVVGADAGTGVRILTNRKDAKLTLNLLYTSLSNQYLQGIVIRDNLTGLNTSFVTVKDLFGRDLMVMRDASIMKPPDIQAGRNLSPRGWVFEALDAELTPSGVSF